MADAFKWTDLLGPGLGLAGSLIGNKIQAGASEKSVEESRRQFDINTQRSDAIRAQMMPFLRTNMGGAPGLGSAPMPYQSYAPSASAGKSDDGGGFGIGDVAKTALGVAPLIPGVGGIVSNGLGAAAGAIGKGLGAAGGAIGNGIGALAGFMASNPIGWLAAGGLGAGLLVNHYIGQGREAADRLTGGEGAQGEFGALLQEIAKREAAGQMTPEQRQQALSAGLDAKIQQAIAAAKSGEDKLVIRQWLGDFSNQDWMRDHPYLQPIAQKYLPQVQPTGLGAHFGSK